MLRSRTEQPTYITRLLCNTQTEWRRIEARLRGKYHMWLFCDENPIATLLGSVSPDLCTRIITGYFKKKDVQSFQCADPACPHRATDRCHGEAPQDRPGLLLKAWENLCSSAPREGQHVGGVCVSDILLEFLKLHADPDCGFRFKCNSCHKKEKKKKTGPPPRDPSLALVVPAGQYGCMRCRNGQPCPRPCNLPRLEKIARKRIQCGETNYGCSKCRFHPTGCGKCKVV